MSSYQMRSLLKSFQSATPIRGYAREVGAGTLALCIAAVRVAPRASPATHLIGYVPRGGPMASAKRSANLKLGRSLFYWIAICSALAQVDTGTISGIIKDNTSAVVPGAAVRIVQLETNAAASLVTNDAGFYSAPALRPGKYEITVSKPGFRTQKSPPIELRVQDRVAMDFQLELGSTSSE